MTASTPTPRRRGHRHGRTAILTASAAAVTAGFVLAGAGVAAASPATPTNTAANTAATCADGPWQVHGASVDGEPIDFQHGDPGATYLWHDGDGWHLRTTDVTSTAHHYTGTITASPGASFEDVAKQRLDPGDHLWVTGSTLHYDFTTHAGVDGVNFRVAACGTGDDTETLSFDLLRNGAPTPSLIDLGQHRTHPGTDPFVATR